jgi:tetratricopeptide (TPR) repeat protein
MIYRSFIFILASIPGILSTSCSSSEASKGASISAIAAAEQDNQWFENYKKATSSCKSFKDFLVQSSPTPEIKGVVDLRYKQKCNPKENLIKDLKFGWLKKDATLSGLRETSDPDLFAQYYEAYLNLDVQARSSLEFLERASLYKKNLSKISSVKQKELFEKMLYMFPAFYVDYKKSIPNKKQFEAAYGLRMQRKFSQSRKIYSQIILEAIKNLDKSKSVKAKVEELDNIFKAYEYSRVTYRVEERKDLGIAESKKAYKFFHNFYLKNPKKEYSSFYTDTATQLARDIWTEGQVDEAKKRLTETAGISPKPHSLDQVYWVLGRMEQEKQNYAGAIGLFEKALKEDPEKEFQLKLLWLVAWNSKKNNQLEKAIEGLEKLESKSKGPEFESYYYKSLFWQAILYKELKNDEKATKIFKEVAEGNPFGYYGRVSALEANPQAFENVLSQEIKLEKTDVVDQARERTIKILLKMDESEILSEYLEDLWKSIGKSARKKISTKLQFLSWANDSGLYKENQQIIEIIEPDSKLELFGKAPSLFYPQPYFSIVEKYSKKFKVPYELAYSIMRQESLFDKKARSQADAFGLLQLLPRVAEKHMDEAGVTFSKPEELYEPSIILPLGIAHLLQLMRIFDDSMLLTAVSYNAGVNPVKGWLKNRYNGNAYEFIEDIPYLESESYAKLVFRNLSFYVQFDKKLSAKSKVDLLAKYFVIKTPHEK